MPPMERLRPGKKRQHQMVGWYDPLQLLRTGKDVVVSLLIGTRADYRLLESLTAEQGVFDDYASEEEIWADYVADLGDGWNSTYTIASLLAMPLLTLSTKNERRGSFETKRGRILIMGGDQVYPSASRDGYRERTIAPYQCALFETEVPHPNLFAIPGNHDWYDGLISFMRIFCQGRWVGGWLTRQRRSYFVIQLPHRWWLWGLDLQLESDIDQPQLEYFVRAAEKVQDGDRIILLLPEPHWIYGNIYDPKLQNNIAFLERKVISKAKGKVQIMIAGDLHHYRRHEADDGSQVQLITSGGGGAFLHPTYGPPVDRVSLGRSPHLGFELKAEFPDRKTSKRLLRRDLVFSFLNLKFGILPGLLYLTFAGLLQGTFADRLLAVPLTSSGVKQVVPLLFREVLASPSLFAAMGLVLAGFILFTDTHKKVYRYVAGSLHAGANLFAMALVGWMVVHGVNYQAIGPAARPWMITLGLFAGGYVAGSVLMGLYLYLSLRLFGRHSNEAFSALRIQDYKNFVRMHIDREGRLTIFPVGVVKVPTKWDSSGSDNTSELALVPAGGARIDAVLIEPPIRIT